MSSDVWNTWLRVRLQRVVCIRLVASAGHNAWTKRLLAFDDEVLVVGDHLDDSAVIPRILVAYMFDPDPEPPK